MPAHSLRRTCRRTWRRYRGRHGGRHRGRHGVGHGGGNRGGKGGIIKEGDGDDGDVALSEGGGAVAGGLLGGESGRGGHSVVSGSDP